MDFMRWKRILKLKKYEEPGAVCQSLVKSRGEWEFNNGV